MCRVKRSRMNYRVGLCQAIAETEWSALRVMIRLCHGELF
jgi:hypothetical protein